MLVRIHRYTAFAIGAWFVLLGLTGAALVWREEIDRWLNPALLTAPGTADDAAIVAVHRAAGEVFPGAHVERLYLPSGPDQAVRALLRKEGQRRVGSARMEAMFSPADARLLGTRDPDARSLARAHLMQTVYDLHHRLLLGNGGKDAVGLAGLALVATTLLGLVLAVPRLDRGSLARAFAIKRRAGAKRIVWDLHRAVGMIGAALLLLVGTTGAMMAYPEYARDLVGLASPVRSLPAVPWRPGDAALAAARPDLASLLATVRRTYPGYRVTEVHVPVRPASPALVYLHRPGDAHRLGDTLVLLHAITGEKLVERSRATRTAGEGLLHWLFPLHSGTALGLPGRWLAFATGVLPLWLLCSGLLVWWLKRRRGRRDRDDVHVAGG